MERIPSDLKGVVVYLDHILVNGSNEEEHIKNLQYSNSYSVCRIKDSGTVNTSVCLLNPHVNI